MILCVGGVGSFLPGVDNCCAPVVYVLLYGLFLRCECGCDCETGEGVCGYDYDSMSPRLAYGFGCTIL